MLEGYLDYYRATLLRKLDALPEPEQRRSRLPSGWTPLELVRHLTYVERRWLCWGFEAEPVPDPWGDRGPSGAAADPWKVPDGMTSAQVVAAFQEQAARSREITSSAALDARARTGGRFEVAAQVPTLAWILFHLLQEYARHVGQLDVVVELAAGATGE
nr:DinB family protein [Streptomyces boncukensis]